MSSEDELHRLRDVTRVMYDREYAKVADILAREGAILRDLGRLDQLAATGRDMTVENSTMHAIGADLHWQAWQSRTRAQLNSELAQLRAQKMVIMAQVRKAFGRDQAVEKLAENRNLERKDRLRKREKLRLLGLE